MKAKASGEPRKPRPRSKIDSSRIAIRQLSAPYVDESLLTSPLHNFLYSLLVREPKLIPDLRSAASQTSGNRVLLFSSKLVSRHPNGYSGIRTVAGEAA